MVNGTNREQTPEIFRIEETRFSDKWFIINERKKLKITLGMTDNGRDKDPNSGTDNTLQTIVHLPPNRTYKRNRSPSKWK